MKVLISVLIVDDHPMIIDSYLRILESYSRNHIETSFVVDTSNSISKAVLLVNNSRKQNPYDLVLLGICLPKCDINNIYSGADLGCHIKRKIPQIKIVVITALKETIRLLNIIKKLNPEGLLIKSDIDHVVLVAAIKSVLDGHFYYSHSIVNVFNTQITQNIVLDDLDIQLLTELSNCAKMKELEELLPLTRSGIDKRKRLLKEKLGVISNSDRDLVLTAKEKGFI
ncbi:response regulator [Bizionia sp. KMM 8389]